MRLVKLVPRKRRMRADRLARLAELLREARRGAVTAICFVAVGSDFATWYGQLGAITRQERVCLIGQLELMKQDLIDQENEAE
jgi:hypothetical protein